MLKQNFIHELVYKFFVLTHRAAQETGKLPYHFVAREKCR